MLVGAAGAMSGRAGTCCCRAAGRRWRADGRRVLWACGFASASDWRAVLAGGACKWRAVRGTILLLASCCSAGAGDRMGEGEHQLPGQERWAAPSTGSDVRVY
jgi:hypothetical protein